MIVDRLTIPRESGKGSEVLALLREKRKLFPDPPHAVRIYAPMFSPYGEIVVETEWESLEELGKWYLEARPTAPEEVFRDWEERFNAVTRAGGRREVWELME